MLRGGAPVTPVASMHRMASVLAASAFDKHCESTRNQLLQRDGSKGEAQLRVHSRRQTTYYCLQLT